MKHVHGPTIGLDIKGLLHYFGILIMGIANLNLDLNRFKGR